MKTKLQISIFLLVVFFSNLSAEFYTPMRLAYPAICKDHFNNNIATKMTWMEPEDNDFIAPMIGYCKYIPTPYEADCYGCSNCGGVGLDLYNGFEIITDDVSMFDEILKGHQNILYNRLHNCENDGEHCEYMCWDGGYFRKWNRKYSHFFCHFLNYCSENVFCNCYWTEINLKALQINNRVYEFIKNLCEDGLINSFFSPYWVAKEINFDYYKKFYSQEYYPNSQGMASSLTTYTFFYSQYQQMLLSVGSYIDSNTLLGEPIALNQIYDLLESIRLSFLPLYNQCLRKHPHPKIYYERGMLYLHSGEAEKALNDMHELMKLGGTYSLTSEMYQQEGETYADLGVYDKAIASLTEALSQDPNNKEAYFHRAYANFESGNFEQALKDYALSKKSEDLLKIRQMTSSEFNIGLLSGLSNGGYEAATEFFPSLWHSTCGLTQTMWAAVQSPKQAKDNFCNACHEMVSLTRNYFKELDWDKIEDYSYEFKDFCNTFNKLSDTEKGQKIGYLISKYGVDIFAGGASLKGIAALKKMKNANKICNLEAMLASQADKEFLIAAGTQHAFKRQAYFKNVQLHVDRQNKHVIGSHNYEPCKSRSILTHPEPQKLLSNYAGTGIQKNNMIPGNPGYVERVDFNEIIGFHIDSKNPSLKTPTTKGTIKYSMDGAHIVPSNPNG